MLLEESLRRPGNARALARRDGLAGAGQVAARLHLDQRQDPAAPRDQVGSGKVN